MNKIYDLNLILFIILGLICYFFFDPVLHPDSLGYINYDSVRSVGYSSIINLFGKNLETIVALQILFTIIACSFFLKTLRKIFYFNNFAYLFISLVLIIISLKISLNILTGSFAFSLFLISLTFCINTILTKRFPFLIYATLFLFIGILIRPQLIFFGPTIIFFSLYLVSLTKQKKFFLIIPFVSILFLVPQQINKYFNNFYNQVNVPMTDSYNQLMILPLFISKIELNDYFEDQKLASLFVMAHNCSSDKRLNKKIVSKEGQNWLYVLESNSFPVKNCVNISIDKSFLNLSVTEKEIVSKDLFINTIKAQILFEPIELFISYFEKLSSGFMNKYYFAIFCLFTIFVFIYFLLIRNNQIFLFLVILISHFFNMFIICLGAPMLTRYTFYTEILILLISFSIIINFLNPIKQIDEKK